jgi:starch phosphorylase
VARRIAYFSVEVALDPAMPTYSGGLGALAGDTLRSCADLKIPVVGVSLLYWKGYFEQKLDEWGNQQEYPVTWDPRGPFCVLPTTVSVTIEGRTVVIQAWQYDLVGVTGYRVPLLLLDANRPENASKTGSSVFGSMGETSGTGSRKKSYSESGASGCSKLSAIPRWSGPT